MKKQLIFLLSFAVVLSFLSSSNSSTIDDKKSDFIDNLLAAYDASGKDAEIECQNEDEAIIFIKKNDQRILIDKNNEKIISSNYKGESLTNNKRIRKFAKKVDNDESSFYEYDSNGNLINISSKLADYSFEYNQDNKLTKRYINENCILEKEYYSFDKAHKESFLNGYEKVYVYDDKQNLTQIKDNDGILFLFDYDNDSLLESSYDAMQNKFTYYHYLDKNHLDYIETSDGYRINYFYDQFGNITERLCFLDDNKSENILSDNKITSNGFDVSYQNDLGDRVTSENITFNGREIYENQYDYIVDQPKVDESITEEEINKLIDDNEISYDTRIKSIQNKFFDFNYKYSDQLITNFAYGNNSYEYTYDDKEQLISYTMDGISHNISYDELGNILEKDSKKYFYDEKSMLLLSYNDNKFFYDENMNPTIFKGDSLEWNGRQLKKYNNTSFSYDKNGYRTSKINSFNKVEYFYDNGKVIFEKNGNNLIKFYYADDEIIGLNYDGNNYFYIKDKDKNILAIIDELSNIVVEYKYDPFGKIINIDGKMKSSLGVDNPYRYHSYRYDNDTDLYYLQTRYYDPEIGRFVNADDPANLSVTIFGDDLTKNIFAYCNNSPVNYDDSDGRMATFLLKTTKSLYADLRLIPDSLIGSTVLPLNGLNFWTAFHETAQLVACKQLNNEEYLTDVEYPIKNGTSNLEADVLAYSGINYLYEVKKFYESQSYAETQLNKYCSLTGFIPGKGFTSKEIKYLGSFYMNVFHSGNGIIRYQFTKKWSAKLFWYNVEVKKEIKEEDFEKALCVATWAGLITASAIILATIVEDFITCGAGVADDSASIVVAAQSYSSSVGTLAFCLV